MKVLVHSVAWGVRARGISSGRAANIPRRAAYSTSARAHADGDTPAVEAQAAILDVPRTAGVRDGVWRPADADLVRPTKFFSVANFGFKTCFSFGLAVEGLELPSRRIRSDARL